MPLLLDRLLAGLLGLVGAVLQLVPLVLEALLLVLKTLGTVAQFIEDAYEILLPRPRSALSLSLFEATWTARPNPRPNNSTATMSWARVARGGHNPFTSR